MQTASSSSSFTASPSGAMPVPSMRRATLRFMLSHPAHFIALGFGSGLPRFAPGTVGTLWAWASFLLLQPLVSTPAWALLIGAGTLVGWWACTVTAQHMRVSDSGHIVWDEVVAFWLVLWLIAPAGFWAQLVAFVLFRFFDAVKFGPMAWADQTFKGFGPRGGFGILLDDFAAALCTLLLVLALARELKSRGLMMATAESCTGGLIAGACTDVSGSSDWFERGFVTYSNAAKSELLGVPAELIEHHGAVSEPVARAMAAGALAHSPAQLTVAVTGVAGPTG
eukprot:gene44757-59752_t